MIDVIFQLLLFFICASAGAVNETLLPQNLPPGDIASAKPLEVKPEAPDKIWVFLSLRAGGKLVMKLNETEYDDFDDLKQQLQALSKLAAENPVILDIADEVPAGEMIRVYDTCRAGGFKSIHFNVRPVKLAKARNS